MSTNPTAAEIAAAIRDGSFYSKVSRMGIWAQGVGRMADNPRALLVILTDEPSDDDIRSLHDHMKKWVGKGK